MNIEPERIAPVPRPGVARAAVVGGGPAGLIAAQTLIDAGANVTLYDSMPSVGRKFLLAGKGGLNLTHSEPLPDFVSRYGAATTEVARWLQRFGPEALRDLARNLGFETFVGSSGRVFPADMKAGPLLRTWLRRLRDAGVAFRVRHRFVGWTTDGHLLFTTPEGTQQVKADVVVLALGGGSWARLGSDGAWVELLRAQGIEVAPLLPSNCGFECAWTPVFADHCEGQPLKTIAARVAGESAWQRGEMMVTRDGIEGSLVYALSPRLRDTMLREGHAVLELDLMPDRNLDHIEAALARPRGSRSRSEHWRRSLGLTGAKAGLLREVLPRTDWDNPAVIARALKALPLTLRRTRPIDEAISTAGGVRFEAVDARLMLHARPATFVAGEMLDWEAPTGGYLLTAAFASGVVAAEGALAWWQDRAHAL